MKIIKILFFSVLSVFLVSILALFIFIKTFDINKYLAPITQQLSQSIGRQVGVQRAGLDLNFNGNISLVLHRLSMAEDLKPNSKIMMTIEKVIGHVDISALLKKEINLTDLRIEKLILAGMEIKEIKAKANHFSLNEPFDFNLSVNAYSKVPYNIEITARCVLDLKKSNATISDIKITSDLAQWDLPILSKDLGGQLLIQAPLVKVSSQGIDDNVALNVVLNNAHAKFQEILIKTSLTADFIGSAQSFDPQVMMATFKGSGNIDLKETRIENFNILNTIVSKLNFIPGLILEGFIPPEIQEKLSSPITVLDKVQSKITIQDKVISITDAQIESKLISILAQGKIDFNLMMDINVDSRLSEDLSMNLVKHVKLLKSLLDENNRIYIPGRVSGQVPSVGYKPEVDYIAKKAAVSQGVQQLEKVLDKNPQVKDILNAVLGGGESKASDGQSTDNDSQNPSKEEKSKELINNVLNKIFK